MPSLSSVYDRCSSPVPSVRCGRLQCGLPVVLLSTVAVVPLVRYNAKSTKGRLVFGLSLLLRLAMGASSTQSDARYSRLFAAYVGSSSFSFGTNKPRCPKPKRRPPSRFLPPSCCCKGVTTPFGGLKPSKVGCFEHAWKLTILTRDGSAGFAQKIEGRGSTSGTDWQPLVAPACLLSRVCCRSSDLPPGSRAQPRRVGLNYQRSSDFARFSRSSFTQFLLLLSSRLHTRLSGPRDGRSTWGWVTGTIKADKIRRVVGGVRCRGEVAWQGWLDAMRCDVGEARGRRARKGRERGSEQDGLGMASVLYHQTTTRNAWGG
jgi:hypothetical protein